tara:strand:+ start:226 stop:1029 length:804 start_codon:yes stop_codon:yes gene_type:complete
MALFSFIKNLNTCFILLFLLTSSLNAEVIKEKHTLSENTKFNLNIGMGVINTPKYEGSDNSISRIVPFVDFKYKKLTFNPINGVSYNFFSHGNWLLKYGVGLNLGRDPKQDNSLSGLNKINWTLEPKVMVKYKSKFYSTSSELTYDILQKGHKGYYLKTSLGSGFPIFKLNIFFIPSISFTYADKTYLNNYFGVDTKENISSGYSLYNLSGGIKDITANILGIYKLNDNLSLNANFSYKRLIGQVAKSPIVLKKNNITSIFSINYSY